MELKPLVSPSTLVVDRETLTEDYGRFFAEPFERGYGRTIGNSLRRILLFSVRLRPNANPMRDRYTPEPCTLLA